MSSINPQNIVRFHPYPLPKLDVLEKSKATALNKIVRSTLQKMQKSPSVTIDRQFFINAWKSKDLEQIRLCLELNGSWFGRETLGNLLIQGAEEGFESGIALLLDKDPSLVAYVTHDKENSKISRITALHAAAAVGRKGVCSLLLRRGADPEARTLIKTGYSWNKNRKQIPGDTYVVHGLKKRTDRGFSDLVNYVNNPYHNKEGADWEIFKEIDVNERSCKGKTLTVLEHFMKTYSIFESSMHFRCRGKTECQRTEEVIEFLLQMGADPGLLDQEGDSLLDWIKEPYKYKSLLGGFTYDKFTNEEFSQAYVQRIIQRMEQAHARVCALTPHVICQVIMDYADLPQSSQSFWVIKHIITEQMQG